MKKNKKFDPAKYSSFIITSISTILLAILFFQLIPSTFSDDEIALYTTYAKQLVSEGIYPASSTQNNIEMGDSSQSCLTSSTTSNDIILIEDLDCSYTVKPTLLDDYEIAFNKTGKGTLIFRFNHNGLSSPHKINNAHLWLVAIFVFIILIPIVFFLVAFLYVLISEHFDKSKGKT